MLIWSSDLEDSCRVNFEKIVCIFEKMVKPEISHIKPSVALIGSVFCNFCFLLLATFCLSLGEVDKHDARLDTVKSPETEVKQWEFQG